MKSEFLIVARNLLQAEKRPLSARQLVNLALKQKLFSDKIAGNTPHQTMKSKLSVHIRTFGERSIFVRTKPGLFYLRSLLDRPQTIYEAPPLQRPTTSERVLVFPSAWLDKKGRFQGIRKQWNQMSRELLRVDVCHHIPRLQAEGDNEHKQILTYIMVSRKRRLLAFKRGTYNRVEDFLRGSECIGFGGHVAEVDRTLFNIRDLGLMDNAIRELSEEIKVPEKDIARLRSRQGLRIVGLLNDDSSPAGRRHFAFVLMYEASSDPSWQRPVRGEKSITRLRWVRPSELSLWDYEYWSQLCLREYFPEEVRTLPAYVIRRRNPLNPPHILCVLGRVSSGKSETTAILKRDFGYKEVNSGKVLARILKVPPVPETPREHFQDLAWNFINREEGPRLLAEAMWKEAKALSCPKILIDGIRQTSTLEHLKGLTSPTPMGLLFVHTPPDIAYKFYSKRSMSDTSIHDFLRLREAPVEGEVEEFIDISDAVLYNWAGLKRYRMAVRALFSKIMRR
ncbi:MAG: HTH domain-containing protein [Nitrospiraceae bacterium]